MQMPLLEISLSASERWGEGPSLWGKEVWSSGSWTLLGCSGARWPGPVP